MKTYDLGQGWFAVHNDAGMKHETMVIYNSNNDESIALGSESCQKLREIFKKLKDK